MQNSKASWKLLVLAGVLPILVLATINLSLGDDFESETFKRFGNALLTSYIIMGTLLLGNLFFYANSRHRPAAPFVGMIVAIGIGLSLGWVLISYDDLLLEANGSLRAQALSNIVHFLVIATAMLLGSILAIGATFAAITGRPRRVLFREEE
ncbi:MAG: hypothetical protein QGI21_00635 [Candidatus Poseidoniaceae archaeon]|nr:hypothetical protein [Candidatus Poseidoniaceae archaeon]